VEVTSNWGALLKLGAKRSLVEAAAALDRKRVAGEDGLVWTPQFREIESIAHMCARVGDRMARAFFVSDLHERALGGRIQDVEAAAACRMLDEAGYGHVKVAGRASSIPNLHGYPRAVTA